MLQYIPHLEAEGIECHVEPLLDNAYLDALYSGRKVSLAYLLSRYTRRLSVLLRARRFDLAYVEKELLPNVPAWMEQLFVGGSLPYAVDFDDAIFHNYDMSGNPLKRLLRHKIGAVMRHSNLVTAGNTYLAQHAHDAGARRVALLPTVIDLRLYPVQAPRSRSGPLVIGWIGSPSTVSSLEPLLPVLASLEKRFPIELAVVGASVTNPAYRFVRNVPWREETEAEEISRFDIGVMPLPDRPWERGKCSYKLIQCMACGKPVVASPVGMNVDVVQDGRNGFLASSANQWQEALAQLLADGSLRSELGARGRQMVEERFCLQVTAERLVHLLKDVISPSEAELCVE